MNGVINRQGNSMHHNTLHPGQQAEQYVRMTVADYKKIEHELNSLNARLQAYANLQNQLHQRDQELAQYKKMAREYRNKYDQLMQKQTTVQGNIRHPLQANGFVNGEVQNSLALPVTHHVQAPSLNQQSEKAHGQLQQEQQILMHQLPPPQPLMNGHIAGMPKGSDPNQQHMMAQQFLFSQHIQSQPPEDLESGNLSLDFPLTSNGGTSSGMDELLESLVSQQNQLQKPGHAPLFHNPVSNWTCDSIAVDGDGDMSLEILKKSGSVPPENPLTTSESRPRNDGKMCSMPSIPKRIFRELLQNNVRMQRSLTDLLSSRETRLTQLEYEAVIAQLSSRVTDAEGRYKRLKNTVKECEDDPEKFGEKIADYETQIAELRNVLTLKQSLLKFYTNEDANFQPQSDDKDENTNEKPENIDAEVQTAQDVDDLALGLANTRLEEEISSKSSMIARLKGTIEQDEFELKQLEEKKVRFEKELTAKEAALNSIKGCMESQARKLKDTVEEVSHQERRNQQLQEKYKEKETKLANLQREIESKSNTTGDNEEMNTLYLTQINQYQEDYNSVKKDNEALEAQNQRLAEENEKLRLMMKQKEQERVAHSSPRRPTNFMPDRSARCSDYDAPWLQKHQYRQQLVQDGPPSTFSSLHPSPSKTHGSPVGTPEHRSGSPHSSRHPDSAEYLTGRQDSSPKNHREWATMTQSGLECQRCFRRFMDMANYNSHVKKCTD